MATAGVEPTIISNSTARRGLVALQAHLHVLEHVLRRPSGLAIAGAAYRALARDWAAPGTAQKASVAAVGRWRWRWQRQRAGGGPVVGQQQRRPARGTRRLEAAGRRTLRRALQVMVTRRVRWSSRRAALAVVGGAQQGSRQALALSLQGFDMLNTDSSRIVWPFLGQMLVATLSLHGGTCVHSGREAVKQAEQPRCCCR